MRHCIGIPFTTNTLSYDVEVNVFGKTYEIPKGIQVGVLVGAANDELYECKKNDQENSNNNHDDNKDGDNDANVFGINRNYESAMLFNACEKYFNNESIDVSKKAPRYCPAHDVSLVVLVSLTRNFATHCGYQQKISDSNA